MPTYSAAAAFRRDAARLSTKEREAFMLAVSHMVEDLRIGHGFRKGLRIKGIRGAPGLFEMTWAPDGRAIFTYGPEIRSGETHIVWVAIGTHDIFG